MKKRGILVNLGKDREENLLTLGIASIAFATACHTLYPVPGYPILFGGLGAASIAVHCLDWNKKYRILFENCGIKKGDVYPQLRNKVKTNYGYYLKFSLPTGLSSNDFAKNKQAIEQYLNKRVEIKYADKSIIIQVYEKELQIEYEYMRTETKGILEFPVGFSFSKMENVDLTTGSPHVLVAGETGSGKSTLLRGILTHLITTKSENDLKLHLIDLKRGAELSIFRRCKMVESFSRTKEEALVVLNDISQEIDRRYDLFFKSECVDIKEYNTKFKSRKLNYQLVVIDEFADLQDEKYSIKIIEELAAKARACGIHLIVSTQRPDSKILNGRIKANIPIIIGLKTMNDVNSRIIIDNNKLEELRGRGHGILKYNGKETEFQAMYLQPQQARDLVKHTYRSEDIVYVNKPSIKKQTILNQSKKKETTGKVESLDFLKALGGLKNDN